MAELPSGGMTYPKDFKVSITPYSFGDVLSLTRAPEVGAGALDKILDGVKCSFDKELLLPQDVLYLGIYRKLVSTKHAKIEFHVECSSCAFDNHKVVEMSALKFREVKIPELPIVAELSSGEMHFNPITIKQYKEVLKHHKGDSSWLLANSVANMDSFKARDIIMNAVDVDKEILDEVTQLLDFGLEPIEFTCQDEFCGAKLSVQLEDPTTIVFPFRAPDESAKNRIKFGIKPPSKCSGDADTGL